MSQGWIKTALNHSRSDAWEGSRQTQLPIPGHLKGTLLTPRVVQGPPTPLAAPPRPLPCLALVISSPGMLRCLAGIHPCFVFSSCKSGHTCVPIETTNNTLLMKCLALITPATAQCEGGVENRCEFSPALSINN